MIHYFVEWMTGSRMVRLTCNAEVVRSKILKERRKIIGEIIYQFGIKQQQRYLLPNAGKHVEREKQQLKA